MLSLSCQFNGFDSFSEFHALLRVFELICTFSLTADLPESGDVIP